MSKESLYIVLFLAWILYKVFGKQFFKSLNQKPTTLNPEPETQNSEPKAQRPNYKDLIEKMIWHKETENFICKVLSPYETFNKAS